MTPLPLLVFLYSCKVNVRGSSKIFSAFLFTLRQVAGTCGDKGRLRLMKFIAEEIFFIKPMKDEMQCGDIDKGILGTLITYQ